MTRKEKVYYWIAFVLLVIMPAIGYVFSGGYVFWFFGILIQTVVAPIVIGFGALFLILGVIQTIRRRRSPKQQ